MNDAHDDLSLDNLLQLTLWPCSESEQGSVDWGSFSRGRKAENSIMRPVVAELEQGVSSSCSLGLRGLQGLTSQLGCCAVQQ